MNDKEPVGIWVSEKCASGKENVKCKGPEMRTGWTSPKKRKGERGCAVEAKDEVKNVGISRVLCKDLPLV